MLFDQIYKIHAHLKSFIARIVVFDEPEFAAKSLYSFRVLELGTIGARHHPVHSIPVKRCKFDPRVIPEVEERVIQTNLRWHESLHPCSVQLRITRFLPMHRCVMGERITSFLKGTAQLLYGVGV